MVKSCSAFGCSNRATSQTDFKFFRFPKNPVTLKIWLRSLKRIDENNKDWKPGKHSWICSAHFKSDDLYTIKPGGRTRLRKGAVPSEFDFPKHLQQNSHHRRQPVQRRATSPPSPAIHSTSDHSYVLEYNSEFEHIKHNNASMRETVVSLRKELKDTKRKLKAKEAEVENLKDILLVLKNNQLLKYEENLFLSSMLPEATTELFQNAAKNCKRSNGRSYTRDIKSFAMSLFFMSPKAYDFVREKLFLPHPNTLHNWFRAIDGDPGFTDEVFRYLEKVTTGNDARFKCSLAIDEMAIRKEIKFQGGVQTGFIDYGTGFDADIDVPASEVLVFMLVSIDSSWKIPVAYFFANGLSSKQKAAFVSIALGKLHSVGVDVISVVCDGLRSNMAMFEILGSGTNEDGILSSFPHVISGDDVFPVFDACHMLKLLRNLLGEKKFLVSEGRVIKWMYIEMLENVQDKNLLKLATSIGKAHVQWYKQKMKVKLAAQVFSLSVANALRFLKEIMPEFKDADPTIEFIEVMNSLFDCLNSRNPCGRFLKSPVRLQNLSLWLERLYIARDILLKLEFYDGKQVIKSRKSTVVIGFITTIDSLISLVKNLITNVGLKYVLTFKFSQDHIEVFFAAIRSKGGNNNNPSTTAFKAAYRQLIISRLQKIPVGNVSIDTGMQFLELELEKKKADFVCEEIGDFSITGVEVIKSLYVENSVMYIAGFVSKKVSAALKCDDCKVALFDTQLELINEQSMYFLNIKDNGGLSRPSRSVFMICMAAEQAIRSTYFGNGFKCVRNAILKLQCHVIQSLLGQSIFEDLNDHLLSFEIDFTRDDHVTTLKKLVIEKYAAVRFHHSSKVYTQKIKGTNVRHDLTKLVLFKNQ